MDQEKPTTLDWFEQMIEFVKPNSSIDHRILNDPSGSLKWLELSSTNCHVDPQLGPIRTVRLVVSTTRTYKVDVLYPIPRSVERLKGLVTDDFERIINMIQESGGYVLCPGIQPEWYEETYKTAGYQRENVRTFQLPIKRYEAADCFLWHKPRNRYTKVGDKLFNVCANCKLEAQRSQRNATRTANVNKEVKDARKSTSSKYPMAKLSPNDQSEKLKRLKAENKINRHRLQQLLSTSRVRLNSLQGVEMEDVIQTDPAAKSEVQAVVLSECGDPGSTALLESAAMREDGTTERQQFCEDQVKVTVYRFS